MRFAQKSVSVGFTVIELMVVVAFMAIIAGIAAPNLHDWVIRSNIASITTDRLAAINFARAEAVSSRRNVSLCAQGSCGSSTNWSGAIAVVQGACSTTPTVIKTFDASYPGYDVTSSVNCITFLPAGTTAAVGANISASFSGNTAFNRMICISTLGRPRLINGSSCP
jgi:type IV fimbrial biogenesis protein FimT